MNDVGGIQTFETSPIDEPGTQSVCDGGGQQPYRSESSDSGRKRNTPSCISNNLLLPVQIRKESLKTYGTEKFNRRVRW